ncbi:MAG TPA: recombination mediator RecR [Planctomycetota bacterium]|nr:recombination mediator RecR [Planctomycetota bacterium]
MYPPALERLIEAFSSFPGVGRRTAERLAFHILRVPIEEAEAFARAVGEARAATVRCSLCFNVGEADPCGVCADPARDRRTLCVVEEPRDVWAIEKARVYRGLYHVLLGSLNPAEGAGPDSLTVEPLVRRVREGGVEEVILGTDPDLEGDGTALFVAERLEGTGARVTRLARGLPAGSAIEYLNRVVLADALEGRREMRGRPGS